MGKKWGYLLVALDEAGGIKKHPNAVKPDRLNAFLGAEGWKAVGLSLKKGDLVARPEVLLKRPMR